MFMNHRSTANVETVAGDRAARAGYIPPVAPKLDAAPDHGLSRDPVSCPGSDVVDIGTSLPCSSDHSLKRITHAQAYEKYGVRMHKLKRKIRTHGIHAVLKKHELAFLQLYPEQLCEIMRSAELDIHRALVNKLFNDGLSNEDIMKSQNGAHGTAREKDFVKKSTTKVVHVPKGKKVEVVPKGKKAKSKKQHRPRTHKRAQKRLDEGVSKTPMPEKNVKIAPMFTDSTKISASCVMQQQISMSSVAPSIIWRQAISFLAAGVMQDANSQSSVPGYIASQAPNFLWFNGESFTVKCEGNASPMLQGKLIFLSSPVPLTDAQLQLFVSNREFKKGYAVDCKEFNISEFGPKKVVKFPLNIIKGDRPIGINPTPKEESPILTYFYIIQWTTATTMQLGGAATSATDVLHEQVADGPIGKLKLHLAGELIYRCGGLSEAMSVVNREREQVQSTWVNFGTTTHGNSWSDKTGGPFTGLVPPELAQQAQNTLIAFGQNGQTNTQISLGPGLVADFTVRQFTTEEGELLTFVICTIVEAIGVLTLGTPGLSVPLLPIINQFAIAGTRWFNGFMSRVVGTKDTVKSKTTALDVANNTLSGGGPQVGATNIMGSVDPNAYWGGGYASAPLNSAVQSLNTQAAALPATAPAKDVYDAAHGLIFDGYYPNYLIDNGGGPIGVQVSQDNFEITKNGFECIYPTTIDTWQTADSQYAGFPPTSRFIGETSRTPLIQYDEEGVPQVVPANQNYQRLAWINDNFNSAETPKSRWLMFAPHDDAFVKTLTGWSTYPDPGVKGVSNYQDICLATPGVCLSCYRPVQSIYTQTSELNAINAWSSFFHVAPVISADYIVWPYKFSYSIIARAPAIGSKNSIVNHVWDEWRAADTNNELKNVSCGIMEGTVMIARGGVAPWWQSFANFLTRLSAVECHERLTLLPKVPGSVQEFRPLFDDATDITGSGTALFVLLPDF